MPARQRRTERGHGERSPSSRTSRRLTVASSGAVGVKSGGKTLRMGWRVLALVVAGVCVLAPSGVSAASPGSAVASPTNAAAGPSPAPAGGPTTAAFEGRRIDLATSWEGARACIVFRQGSVVECFRTTAESEQRAATLSSTFALGLFSCWSPLRLFEHSFYGGRQIMFFDRYYWQNLGDYGFDDQMTSFKVGACWSYLAEHPNGGGAYYPGSPFPAWTNVNWPAPGWDNRVSSIYIA